MKNVLITGATSEIAVLLIKKLLEKNVIVYALSRSELTIEDELLKKTRIDLTDEFAINNYFVMLNDVKFDAVICFQGVAISAPVEFLSFGELNKQLSISLFSILSILKNLRRRLTKGAKVIAISSMASYGIFPFLAPYEISKSSVDMLLCAYEIETGIKTVSVKPGVVGTKFWKYCVNENKDNFDKFPFEYKHMGEFLKDNEEHKENIEIKDYNEDKLKKLALSSLKEFYALPYNEESVRIAYEKFYSTNYKEILRKTRNIKNADEYVQSNPSLDFEFETTIDKVYDIKLDGKKAYIDVDSSVYDRVEDNTSKARQTFVMSY